MLEFADFITLELVEAVFLFNHYKFFLDDISAVGNRADLYGRTKDRDGTP
jgi:hypothetical protein